MPPDENIWKHSNSNSIFSNVSRVGLRARLTTIVLCKTIAVVSSRIKLAAQGADGANLALIHASSRCRRKDCDISLNIRSQDMCTRRIWVASCCYKPRAGILIIVLSRRHIHRILSDKMTEFPLSSVNTPPLALRRPTAGRCGARRASHAHLDTLCSARRARRFASRSLLLRGDAALRAGSARRGRR